MMQDNEFSYYLQQLHSSESENAYFSLLTDTVDADVPKLIGAFYSEPDLQARVALLEILCQHCVPETLTFLATILQNPVTRLWQSALDGIVGIGSPQALTILYAEKMRLLSSGLKDASTRLEYIDEAIRQLPNR